MSLIKDFKYKKVNIATFAPPKQFQSGRSWLGNRVGIDTALLLGGAAQGVSNLAKGKGFLGGASVKDAWKGMQTQRRAYLDSLDEAANQRGLRRTINSMRGGTTGGLNQNWRRENAVEGLGRPDSRVNLALNATKSMSNDIGTRLQNNQPLTTNQNRRFVDQTQEANRI